MKIEYKNFSPKAVICLFLLFSLVLYGCQEEPATDKNCFETRITPGTNGFWVKSRTSRSVSLHWDTVCDEKTYSSKNPYITNSWAYRMYRSTSPDGPFEKVNKVDMDWFLSHSLSNILLEPSTTYYYKLELVHDTNGFLMQVGDVISVTTDSAEYTPVLTEDDKLSAIEVATREAGGESYYSFIGSLDTISNIDVYLGRINPQNYSINFAVLIENEPEINCDLYYNIFSLDGQFIGRVDSRKFEVNSGEGEATYPMIFGDKYFKVGSFLDITEPIVYQVTISQYME